MALNLMSGGAILLGILIALSTALKWPKWLNYVWAALAVIWGVLGVIGTF